MPFSLMNGVNALGAAFGGYGQDKEDLLKRMQLQRELQGQDFARDFQLRQAGYSPVAQGQQPQGPTISAPQSGGPQSYAYNFDQSPQGILERRQLEMAAKVRTAKNQAAFGTLQTFAKNDPEAMQNPLLAPYLGAGYQDEQEYPDVLKSYLSDQADRRKVAFAAKTDVGKAKDLVPVNVAQAQQTAAAVAPIHTQEAVNTARGEAPIKTQQAIEEAKGKLPGELQLATARAGLTPRAQAADAALPQMADAMKTLSQYNQVGVAGKLFARNALGSYVMSNEGQIADQAFDQFVTSYLAGRGNRNPTPKQIAEYKQQIQPKPGEEGNPTVLANKARRLQEMYNENQQLARVSGAGGSAAGGSIDDVLSKWGVTPVRRP